MSEPVRLTPEETRRLNRRSLRQLTALLVVQLSVSGLVSAIAAAGWGAMSGLSCLCGAMSYILPSAFFVAHMSIRLINGVNAGALTVFFAEAFKIAGTIVLLFLSVRCLGTDLVWPALLAGLLTALKSYVFMLFFRLL